MRMVQLPNGDLWKGRAKDGAEREDTIKLTELSAGESADDVLAQMLTSQKGEQLSCVFCGAQFSRKQLNELSEHVETLHKSSVKPLSDAEVLGARTAAEDLSEVEIALQINAPRLA